MTSTLQEQKDFMQNMIDKLPSEHQPPTQRIMADIFHKLESITSRWDIFGIGEFMDKMSRERKTFFFKIGKGFRNRDDSINLKFNALPLGQCQMRDERERRDEPENKPPSKFDNLP